MKRLIAPLFGGIFLLLASQAQASMVGSIVSAEIGGGVATPVGTSPLGAPEDWGSIATDGTRFFLMNTCVACPGFIGNIVETNTNPLLPPTLDPPVDVGTTRDLFGSPESWTRFAFANDQFYFLNVDPFAGPAFRGKIVVTDMALAPVGEILVSFPDNLGFGDPDLSPVFDGMGGVTFVSDGIRDNDGATGIGPETGFGTDGNHLYFLDSKGGGNIIRVNMDGTGAEFAFATSPFSMPEDWTGFAVASADTAYYLKIPEVPVPAAVWLFGSGLMFLGGLSLRRRKSA